MSHFGFSEWPFANVPTPERGIALWADRAATRTQLDVILDDWRQTKKSSIILMWADLGSGKTHTLYHLQARCRAAVGISCDYILLPTAITNFLGLYSAIARQLDWTAIPIDQLDTKNWTVRSLRKALTWLTSDADMARQNLAKRWLSADKLRSSECEMLGVAQPISTPEDGVAVLAAAIKGLASVSGRVVLMIDEYQRVAEGKRRQLQEIGHGIHTLYNACPSGFSLVLSCATGMSDDYTLVLTPEIVSRLSSKRITLPYLSEDDIVSYVRDLFAHYRDEENTPESAFSPLSEDTVRHFAKYLVDGLNGETTPRRINEAFDQLLSHMRRAGRETLQLRECSIWVSDNGADILRSIG